jgi:hypothetical protein
VGEKLSGTIQVTATVDVAFLARFDAEIAAVGFARADAIREGMRRILKECIYLRATQQRIDAQKDRLEGNRGRFTRS